MGDASWSVLLTQLYQISCMSNWTQTAHSAGVYEQGVHFTISSVIPSLDFCALVLMHTSRKERRNWKGSGRNYVDDERLEKRWSLEPNVFWVSEIVGAGVCDLAGARDQLFPGNSIKKWFHMYEMQTQDRSQGDSNRESKTVFIQWRSLITGTEQQRSGRFSVLLFSD